MRHVNWDCSDVIRHAERTRRLSILALAFAILLAAILRVVLSNYSLWFDEYASLFFASQPFGRLWSAWMLRETNPPLFYAILRGWMLIPVPIDRFWLRIPSITASLLVIPVAYAGINRIYGPKAAAIAALMLAVSAQQIYFGQQVRCYSFLFLALAISFFAILGMVTSVERGEQVTVSAWVAYTGGAVAAIYLHTTAIFWPVIATASLVLVAPQFRPIVGKLWLRLVFANLVIVLCASWWLYITFVQISTPNSNISWLHYSGLRASLRLFETSSLLLRNPVGWQLIISLVLCALAVFGVVRTRGMMATRLIAICWLVTVITYIAISHKQSLMSERALVWIAIFPTTLVAAGLGTIRTQWRLLGGCITVVTLLAVNLSLAEKFEIENWQGNVVTIARDQTGVAIVSGEGDGVVINEACILAFHRQDCPFPVITLPNFSTNAWAHGFAPRVPATPRDSLTLPAQAHVYFIQRGDEQPLRELQKVGVAKSAPVSTALFAGPYARIVPQLEAHSRVENGLLRTQTNLH